MRYKLVLFLLGLSCTVVGQELPVDTILNRMVSNYGTAHTYQDEGYVKSGLSRRLRHQRIRPFKTVLVRDSLFWFSFYQKQEPSSWKGFLWEQNRSIRGYEGLKAFSQSDGDFPALLNEWTEGSLKSSHTIPKLLMPAMIGGNSLIPRGMSVALAGREIIDGQTCIVLQIMEGSSPHQKIWIDEDSLLIHQIEDMKLDQMTVYHPVMNRTIAGPDLIFNARKESRAVFWRYAPIEYGTNVLLILGLILFGIEKVRNRYIRSTEVNPDLSVPLSKPPILQKIGLALFYLAMADLIIKWGMDPGLLLGIITIAVTIFSIILIGQYLVYPNWLYRNKFWVFNAFYCILLTVGLFIALRNIPNTVPGGVYTIVGIPAMLLLIYFVYKIKKERKQRAQLISQTPCQEEKKSTISTEACLILNKDALADNSNEGRILLFHNRLKFIAKDGNSTEILFTSIRNIRIHKEWLFVPAGLELCDYQNKVQYLVVTHPYFWRSKIRRR